MKTRILGYLPKWGRTLKKLPYKLLVPLTYKLYKPCLLSPLFLNTPRSINVLSIYIGKKNDHALYERILKKIDQSFTPLPYQQATFVSRGVSSAIGAYRKLVTEKGCVFEKIYFNDSIDLIRTQKFYALGFEPLSKSGSICVAHKVAEQQGKKITAIYMEYLNNLKPQADSKQFVTDAVKICKILGEIAISEKKILIDYSFMLNHPLLSSFLSKNNLSQVPVKDLRILEEILQRIPQRYGMSDFNKGNLYQNGALIDYDSFQLYPICSPIINSLRVSANQKIIELDQLRELFINAYPDLDERLVWLSGLCCYGLNLFYWVYLDRSVKTTANTNYAKQLVEAWRQLLVLIHQVQIFNEDITWQP